MSAGSPPAGETEPDPIKLYPRLRQSLLASFDDCSLMAHFEALYRKGWSSHPQGRGQLTHRILAKCLQEMAATDNESIPADAALAIYDEVMRQHDVDDFCLQPHCELPATVIAPERRGKDGRSLICADGHKHHTDVVNVPARERMDIRWIVAKWAMNNTFDVRHLVDVERRLEATVRYPAPDGGHVERLVTGQLDAVFVDPEDSTHAIVLDWKDTWKLPAQAEVSFEGYYQQRHYALLVFANYPSIKTVTLREFYVRYSEPREATLLRTDLPAIEADISALVERFDTAVRRQQRMPTPGRHCGFCPRPQSCPIPVAVRAEGRIVSKEDAQRLGGQLVVAETVLKNTRKALQTFVEFNGPVPVKDSKGHTVWAYRKVVTEVKPTKEQAEAAVKRGEDPSKLFKTRSGTRFAQITLKPGEEQTQDTALAAALRASLENPEDPKWSSGGHE